MKIAKLAPLLLITLSLLVEKAPCTIVPCILSWEEPRIKLMDVDIAITNPLLGFEQGTVAHLKAHLSDNLDLNIDPQYLVLTICDKDEALNRKYRLPRVLDNEDSIDCLAQLASSLPHPRIFIELKKVVVDFLLQSKNHDLLPLDHIFSAQFSIQKCVHNQTTVATVKKFIAHKMKMSPDSLSLFFRGDRELHADEQFSQYIIDFARNRGPGLMVVQIQEQALPPTSPIKRTKPQLGIQTEEKCARPAPLFSPIRRHTLKPTTPPVWKMRPKGCRAFFPEI